jgi:hypothetical protein
MEDRFTFLNNSNEKIIRKEKKLPSYTYFYLQRHS